MQGHFWSVNKIGTMGFLLLLLSFDPSSPFCCRCATKKSLAAGVERRIHTSEPLAAFVPKKRKNKKSEVAQGDTIGHTHEKNKTSQPLRFTGGGECFLMIN